MIICIIFFIPIFTDSESSIKLQIVTEKVLRFAVLEGLQSSFMS